METKSKNGMPEDKKKSQNNICLYNWSFFSGINWKCRLLHFKSANVFEFLFLKKFFMWHDVWSKENLLRYSFFFFNLFGWPEKWCNCLKLNTDMKDITLKVIYVYIYRNLSLIYNRNLLRLKKNVDIVT